MKMTGIDRYRRGGDILDCAIVQDTHFDVSPSITHGQLFAEVNCESGVWYVPAGGRLEITAL